MTMMKPFAGIVCKKFNLYSFHRVYDDCVLQYPSVGWQPGVDQPEKVTMKVHGMGHHAAVPVANPYALSIL
jgi:hypothetical protein